ncbi:DUF2778 domain-containing protein [Erwiniaceae bacterium L1_54_6]|nr:DUF2778 domain-containing protein [Erwiniaceae bacterium L1_54_6]
MSINRWINGVQRGNFRLHPGMISQGCITLERNSAFAMLRNRLLYTPLIDVPCTRNLKACGFIVVRDYGYGETCPTRR